MAAVTNQMLGNGLSRLGLRWGQMLAGRLSSSFVGTSSAEQTEPSRQSLGQQEQWSSGGASRDRTSKLEFIETSNQTPVPMYSVLSLDGASLVGPLDPELTPERMVDLYRGMLTLNTMDKVMFDSHRQGRISFYMTSFGEEAVQLGSAGGLEPEDWVYAQYREAGVLLHRKMALKLLLAQCYGNSEDIGKGRQMPIHYGNRALNYVTISSTLATQMPQATGTAYAFKRDASGRVVACYFGEGAASEGDAHAAMNFAATLDCPVIFICRNNGYAISTPAREQYRGDGVISRGPGYGISAIRVDGNDLFAVYGATRAARRICAQHSRPVLIEAMTYRVGHHSTSDDSAAYRSADEVRAWERAGNPLARLYKYLVSNELWCERREKEHRDQARADVIEALNWAEKLKKLPVSSMFDDVYDKMPAHLHDQREQLKRHLDQFGSHYPLNEHQGV